MLFFGSAEDIARLERMWLYNEPIYSESKSTNKLTKTKIIKETHQHINYKIDKKDKSYEKDFYENKTEYLKYLNNKGRYSYSPKEKAKNKYFEYFNKRRLNVKSKYLESLNSKSQYLNDKCHHLYSSEFKRQYWGSLKNLKNHCNESRGLLQCHHRSY